MLNTGERLLTEVISSSTIEHLHRYALALEFVKNKIVVDIASGEGYGSNLLAKEAKKVIGIDLDIEAIQHASNKYCKENLSYMQGSADLIPLDSDSIDIVVSFETIEHHDKHDEMLQEFKRILKPDGVLIISSPDKLYYSEIPNITNKYHVKELYTNEFEILLKKYFTHNVFLRQKVNYCSLIVGEENKGFIDFNGDYTTVTKCNSLKNPVYNIAISSNSEKKQIFSSSFDGDYLINNQIQFYIDSIKKKEQEINEILESKTFKLGQILTLPLRLFRKVFN